ncbi:MULTISPECIES: FecCD family ABC transporter permease [Staphylococcus]|jgi:ABC-type Fe3+-siderophore transport system permease subunit|uniref:FecCD family ABC transporter permease n=1 Tax=Staphylococcus TaxID=1279 RepID=UPI000E69CF10|nr:MULTISPECIES: iron chelate uptake ABC transporter family permease subunit [Staphylococcus]MBO1205869.1 iron chelate uptake ABC transporter family permease subunit [Staphylococcus nepalensis]MCD8891620.1 iron chelate uptake ABC transporter family permease subunit [Staphylococcus nepalensis]MDR5650504.1 iron chelate uptake ABC transporter family permease subunit [Staphylococcus nepalensis]MDW8552165.1 iron chelate uptake ABC transporter family permease subunit [Staphylococcus nepalensis]RIO45
MKGGVTFRYILVLILLILSAIASLSIGAVLINPIEAVNSLFMQDNFIINEYRAPRMFLAFIVGSSLAISGALIQGVVRNALASPDVIGITKGASLFAVVIIMLFPSAPLFILPFGSFIGALMISLILTLLISKFNVKGSKLALIGLAIGAICTAIVQYLLIRNPLDANTALVWLTGSLYGHNMSHVWVILPWFIIALPIIFYYCHQLDILTLGDDVAIALGAKVKKVKAILLFLAVILAGASISVVGGLSFLGLIAPHIARQLVGHKHKHITVMSGLLGALILMISDSLARGIHPPIDIPVGVIVAIVGVPYFLFLLRRL